ncbi:MAG: FAD-dependent oxidoreductase [Acidithiobacillus sp.]
MTAELYRCHSSIEAVNIGIVGGGINRRLLACRGYQVSVYERDSIINATSRATSKLFHGNLRFLENGEFRLVREALRERDAWIERVPHLVKRLQFAIPIYRNSRRGKWFIAAGLFLYDSLVRKSVLPKARRLTVDEVREGDARLNSDGLGCGVELFNGQMDDYAWDFELQSEREW